MKHKHISRALSLLLLLALSASLCLPALAAVESDTVYLGSASDLLAFAERCSYDAWSEGKTVVLQHDIALGGVDFLPIASFGGVFEGNGHTISGLSITSAVSPAGLFAAVSETGVVRELHVEGSVAPTGSAELVGGVAGVNRGTISDCSFVGTVNGEKRTGGIAGANMASGTLRRCSVSGGVFGKNMTGGVVGANHGTVSFCPNRAYVNTNTSDPSLSFEKLDLSLPDGLDSLTSPDTYNVTVDSGGVAGFSDGALLGCRNYGSVGYQHVGYNIGGVAGRSSGHMASCSNEGDVYGRREVGGVVGMAEPFVKIDMTESSLTQIRGALNELGRTIDRTVDDAEGGSRTVSARLNAVNRGIDAAEASARTLTDRLTGYWDDTVREIDRGGEIVETAISMLRDVTGEMVDASGAFSDALGKLESAADALSSDGASGDLSAMARDLRTAADIFDAGTKQINAGLNAIKGSVGPADGVDEAAWRKGVYGEDGALQQLRRGAAQAVSGMNRTTSILAGLVEEMRAGRILLLSQMRDYLTRSGMNDALRDIESGYEQINAGTAYLHENTKIDFAAMDDGFGTLAAGTDILVNGRDGKGGVFRYLGSALQRLSDAADASDVSVSTLRDALSLFRDASGALTGALNSAKKLLDYLGAQDALRFRTLGEQADAAADELYGSMRDVSNNLELLNREAKTASDTVLEDVRQVNRQFTALMNTLLDVVEDMEGASLSAVVEDTSDEDIDAAVNGKVLLCANSGSVNGDIDVGGVAGSMMVYNALDPESDGNTLSSAFHRRYELKCILQDCSNAGAVTGKKDNVGSVCGSAMLGVISGCEAYGTAGSDGGDCVGGIAGYADNTVRKCWSKCSLSGTKYIGGIVGSGNFERSNLRVENCRALSEVTDGAQYVGSIMGAEAGVVSGNLFVSDTLAGINRVSERGKAEPVTYEQLLEESGLPAEFRSFTLRFVANGSTVRTQRFSYGESLDSSLFPDIPAVEGQFARWDRDDLENLRFDTTVTAAYAPCVTMLGSDIARSAERPTFFVLGAFDDRAELKASPVMADFREGRNDFIHRLRSYRRTLLEQWQLEIPDDGAEIHTVRYLPPEGTWGHLELYAQDGENWTRLETGEMGSYLTFRASGGRCALTVISTATPWWIWSLVAAFLLALAALVLQTVLRKKPRRELTDEEKAKAAARRKRRGTVRAALLAAALALGAAVGAIIMLAPTLTESLGLFMLLRNYGERTDVDMTISISTRIDGKTFDADVDYFNTVCMGKRVSCVLWQDIPLYYCDGVMLPENGRAYRAEGMLPDYSRLISHAAALYHAGEVTQSVQNGVRTCHALAEGETARQLLTLLLPGGAAYAPDAGKVELDLVLTENEPTSLTILWTGERDSARAVLRRAVKKPDHTLPQEVRATITSGEYANAEEIGGDLRRLLLTWTGLVARDPLSADIALSANCGPLLLDETLCWQRANRSGTKLSCVSRRGTTLYFTDDSVSTSEGVSVNRAAAALTGTPELLHLAYKAFLLGETESAELGNGAWRCAVTLDEAAMRAFAEAIAPDTASMDLSFSEGSVRLNVKEDGSAEIAVFCGGMVHVVRSDIPASVGARISFTDKTFPTPTQRVLQTLGLE